MNTLKITAASFALCAALAAAGCGGGGGSQQYAQNPPTTVAPAPAPTPAPAPPSSESFSNWMYGLLATPSDGNGQPVDMNALTFAFDNDTNTFDSLFVGHQ